MEYAQEYVNSLITIPSTLIAVAGILIVLRVKQANIRSAISQLLLGSIFPGIGALAFAQWWFAVPTDEKLITAISFSVLQLIVVLVALFLLVYYSEKGEQEKK
jgi:membrane protein CcdC involved in cytochrome C biogenesis